MIYTYHLVTNKLKRGGSRMIKFARQLVFFLSVFLFTSIHAHHGAGVYDTRAEALIDITGTVTDFQFRNPHVLIFIDTPDDSGNIVNWSGELTSSNRLRRQVAGGRSAWSRTTMQPGDTIQLSGNPAGNGSPFLRIVRVATGDGTVLLGADESPAESY
jgi:hypothetical protein